MEPRKSLLRDLLVLLVTFSVVIGGLYLYARVWPPAVIVESGSMMHKECGSPPCDEDVRYGRVGFIDPGDLVIVKDVRTVDDVRTLVEGGRETYGLPGDVIVYFVANDRSRTPIIHRAVAYVEIVGAGDGAEHWVRWGEGACEGGATKRTKDARPWCVYGSEGIAIPSVPIGGPGSTELDPNPVRPLASGFYTKGDNPSTNRQTDQASSLSVDAQGRSVPVPLEWIEGKARGELPWLGLLKLALAGQPNERSPPASWTKVGSAYAPKDLWVMLGVSLAVLVGGPLAYDGVRAARRKRRRSP